MLHFAISAQELDWAEQLLNLKSINLTIKNKNGNTAFHIACLNGYFEFAE
jgi:ankyrin repeat protein